MGMGSISGMWIFCRRVWTIQGSSKDNTPGRCESTEIGGGFKKEEDYLKSDAYNEPDASRGSDPMGLVVSEVTTHLSRCHANDRKTQ